MYKCALTDFCRQSIAARRTAQAKGPSRLIEQASAAKIHAKMESAKRRHTILADMQFLSLSEYIYLRNIFQEEILNTCKEIIAEMKIRMKKRKQTENGRKITRQHTARRLIKNGALAEQYFNGKGMNPQEFERLLRAIVRRLNGPSTASAPNSQHALLRRKDFELRES
jgi:hypothetical protein